MQGPTGNFCTDACRSAHETFIQRAKQLDDMKARGQWGKLIRNGVMVVVLVLIGSSIAHYLGYNVPVIGGFLEGVIPRAN